MRICHYPLSRRPTRREARAPSRPRRYGGRHRGHWHVASLDEFPTARRESLLWHHILEYDYYDLAHLVEVSEGTPPCLDGSPFLGLTHPRYEELRGPRFLDPGHPCGAIRYRLALQWGDYCFICRTAKAIALDHDHLTGMVRGLLCGLCNQVVEQCFHFDGCPYADYLNAPPAEPLSLRHPRWSDIRGRRRWRIRHSGFDPFS